MTRSQGRPRWLTLGLLLSGLVHAGFYWGLGSASASPEPRAPIALEFEPLPPPPEPVAPPPEPEPQPEPQPEPIAQAKPVAPARPAAAAPPPSATATPPEPTPTAPADLTGLTLTNDQGDASWTSAVGSGAALTGPIGPVARAPQRAVFAPAATGAKSSSHGLVALADLSDRPRPPALAQLLRDAYPAEARRLGLPGVAVVLARIERDGVVRQARVVSDQGHGFGDACRRTVLGSRWSPPRDREGRAVATEVRYTCRFRVD